MGNRRELDEMGKKILTIVRNELYMQMHFMGPALGSLRFEMDLWTTTIGTDAESIRFNPNYLATTYLEHPYLLDRAYMHMLMHCLFRHMFAASQHRDSQLWDLAVDIAAELVVDSMDYDVINVTLSDFREEWYNRLQEEIGLLTAERIYRYFLDRERDYEMEDRLALEFVRDDHSFWERMQDQPSDRKNGEAPQIPETGGSGPDKKHEDSEKESDKDEKKTETQQSMPSLNGRPLDELDEEWKKHAKRVEAEMLMSGSKGSEDTGDLSVMLAMETRKRDSFRDFLEQFSVIREETGIDPDSFDYCFYNYGMEVYGNMPLIEENEFRISRKVEELVIAIDTSMSCQDSLVQEFLNETAGILSSQESFFRKVQIHIIECDERIQKDLEIRDVEEMGTYARGFHVKGGGGTDFRPVFTYIEEMQRRGELSGLKGLMYFTDGYGTYPENPTPYQTAFVFRKDADIDDSHVPGWAIRLYLDDEYEV